MDCTLGYGGHAQEILAKILPGGQLLGLDADPVELPKTEARLRALGFDENVFTAHRSNFAGLPQVLAAHEIAGADLILADLGVSSMQIDDPARGFSVKFDGPLDMRMNPQRGQPASALLQKIQPAALAELLDGQCRRTARGPTRRRRSPAKILPPRPQLAEAIRAALPRLAKEDADLTVRRVFQALRIAVNDEFSALETFAAEFARVLEARRPRGDFDVSFRRGPAREESLCRRPQERNLFGNFRGSHPADAGRNNMPIRGPRRRSCAGRSARSERGGAILLKDCAPRPDNLLVFATRTAQIKKP